MAGTDSCMNALSVNVNSPPVGTATPGSISPGPARGLIDHRSAVARCRRFSMVSVSVRQTVRVIVMGLHDATQDSDQVL